FYDDTSATAGTPVLANPIGAATSVDVRQQIVDAQNLANGTTFTADNFVFSTNTIYFYQLVLPSTVSFTNPTTNGIGVNYSGAAATPGVVANDLTSALRAGNAPTVGSRGLNLMSTGGGYFRDGAVGAERGDLNFDQAVGRNIVINGTNSNGGIAMRLYGTVAVVPEAGSITLLALGAGVPLAGIALRRRGK
ncbi:MAG: hypothetical protein H7Y38_15255, partial [Armatimonadetes bacterium]|nr:hypothetical protein [Armatimonadota bacterium]